MPDYTIPLVNFICSVLALSGVMILTSAPTTTLAGQAGFFLIAFCILFISCMAILLVVRLTRKPSKK